MKESQEVQIYLMFIYLNAFKNLLNMQVVSFGVHNNIQNAPSETSF